MSVGSAVNTEGADGTLGLSLTEAAEFLGVHYMTAYKYVRTGRLAATKSRGQWWVNDRDLRAFTSERHVRTPSSGSDPVDASTQRVSRRRYAENLRRRAVNGDDNGAWTVVTEALASGATAAEIHTDVIAPAMAAIGERWAAGNLSIAQEHQATEVVHRILGRMTPMFRHPGRRSATAVIGLVAGDMHSLPASLLADLLCDKLFNVVNLGANTPSAAFIEAIAAADGPVAVGVSATMVEFESELRDTIRDIHEAHPSTPIIVGGPLGETVEDMAGVVGCSAGAGEALEMFEMFRSGVGTAPA